MWVMKMILNESLDRDFDGLTIKEAIVKLLEYPMDAEINLEQDGDEYGHGHYQLEVNHERDED